MSLVSIIKASDYKSKTMRTAIHRHFEYLGLGNDLKPGMRVLIKLNLIFAHKPAHTATTNPEFLGALILELRNLGITDITVADSPGAPTPPRY